MKLTVCMFIYVWVFQEKIFNLKHYAFITFSVRRFGEEWDMDKHPQVSTPDPVSSRNCI